MAFKYNKEWEDELLSLASLKYATRKENFRFVHLVEQANSSNDKRIVRALIISLQYELPGIDQTVYGILSTIDYKLYYEILFENIPQLFESNPRVAANLLDWEQRDLEPYEIKEIFSIAVKYLDAKSMKKYVEILEEYGYAEDEPHSFFLAFFKNRIAGGNDE